MARLRSGLYAVASESGEHGRTLTAALGGSVVCDFLVRDDPLFNTERA